jgi:PAS domain S-box-containing protein
MEQQQPHVFQDAKHIPSHQFSASPDFAEVPTVTLDTMTRLLDFSPDASLVVDPSGTIVLLNAQAASLFGYAKQELLGQSLEVLLPEHLHRMHVAERLHYMDAPHARPMGTGLNLVGRRKDGSTFPVDISLRPFLIEHTLHVMGAIRDMTEYRRLQQLEQAAHAQTQASLEVLQLILDRLPTSVCLVQGPDARLLLANHAATALWGAEWQRGQPMQEFLTTHQIRVARMDGQPLAFEEFAVIRAARSCETGHAHQEVIRHADGTTLPVLAHAVRVDLRGLSLFGEQIPRSSSEASACAALVVHQDVSALKKAEHLKDEFISLATHELRTPVAILAGYADLLLRRAARGKGHALDEEQKDSVGAMKEATGQLTKLTEDLLDVMRLQAGRFPLQRTPTELLTLTRRVIADLQATTQRHQITLQTACSTLWASVDASRLEQILSNLLSNAIKYSPQGGPIDVTIWKEEQTGEASFSVRDHGMGIPHEQQASLFGRFVRADNVRAAHIRGTGLGLYLCRELVERHGGRIWFQSEEHVGSTFVFTLPQNTLAQRLSSRFLSVRLNEVYRPSSWSVHSIIVHSGHCASMNTSHCKMSCSEGN